jgi:hypothetical protein
VSEEKVTLDLIGARLLSLTAALDDLQQRASVMEIRFTAMEARIGGVEQRLDRMIALLLRVAERIGGPSLDERMTELEARLRALEEHGETR